MTQLITKTDFAPYVDIAQNLSDAKLNPRILEAQNFDLKYLMGEDFYYDFISDLTSDKNKNIYNGAERQQGIKPVLVYFTAARLVKALDIHITPNGVMQKRNEFSDHVDTKLIGLKIKEYENLANAYWDEVSRYIEAKGKIIYPLYPTFCGDAGKSTTSGTMIYGIGGDDTGQQNRNYNRSGGRSFNGYEDANLRNNA